MTPASAADMAAEAVNRFGFRLLDRSRNESARNLLLSPYSIAMCVAIACNGAAGDTRDALAATLGVQGDEQAMNRGFQDLRSAVDQAGPLVEIDLASAVWGTPGSSFDDEFLHRVQEFYTAEAVTLPATGTAAADAVNRWASERTGGRIARLVGPDDLTAGLSCVLTSATYFKGLWAAPFDPGETTSRPFTSAAGRRTTVPMMTRAGRYPYLETSDLQAVALDYSGRGLRMYVLLPAKGTVMDWSMWSDGRLPFQNTQVALSLPRFSVACELDLVRPLTELGLGRAFAPGADFSRMGQHGAFISALRHAARIEINEQGTEAAAGTAIVMGRRLPRTVEMIVDRPFQLAVVDTRSGLLLYLGSVTEPMSHDARES